MSTQATDPFTNEGGPSITFATVGEVHSLTVRSVEKKVDTDFVTKAIKTWDNGDPKHVFVFSGEDDGGDPIRLWVRGHMVKAIREATAAAGLKSVIDTKVTLKFDSEGTPPKTGMSPPKLFKAKVEKVAPEPTSFDTAEEPF